MSNRQPSPSGGDGDGGQDGPRWTRRGLSKRAAKAYQGVLEAVLSIPAGAVVGFGADHLLGTSPWGVLAGLVLGFAAFVMRAVRLPARLAAIPEEAQAGEKTDPDRS